MAGLKRKDAPLAAQTNGHSSTTKRSKRGASVSGADGKGSNGVAKKSKNGASFHAVGPPASMAKSSSKSSSNKKTGPRAVTVPISKNIGVKVMEKKAKKIDYEAEAESDSNPIVESETGEESGDDDGVSWPSADEGDGEKGIGGDDGDDDDDNDEDSEEEEEEEEERKGGVDVNGGALDGKKAGKTETNGDTKINVKADSATNPSASSKSAESHAAQRAVLAERKANKPNANSLLRSKQLWERLRRKSHVPLAERKLLIAELFSLISGHVKEFVLKHDAVRIVQTALKYATRDQRRTIARELRGEYRALAMGRYAKFLVGKLIVGDVKDERKKKDDTGPGVRKEVVEGEVRDWVVEEFRGAIRKMINHPEASWILDDVYRGAATKRQKALLLREWFGAEYALKMGGRGATPEDDEATLTAGSDLLKSMLDTNPEKRSTIMKYLWEMINQLVQKKTTGFTMLHDAMLQYYLNVTIPSEGATEFMELLKGDEEGDLLKNLAFTASGARVMALAFARASAKDRKVLLKKYKGSVGLMVFSPEAHRVLLAALDVVDDTVLTTKTIIGEIFGGSGSKEDTVATTGNSEELIMSYVADTTARAFLLYWFTPQESSAEGDDRKEGKDGKESKKHLKTIMSPDDTALLDEVHAIRLTTSKKDPDIRRKEILRAVAPHLLRLVADQAAALIQTVPDCAFVAEVLLGVGEECTEERNAALEAIASLAASESPEIRDALVQPHASRLFKTLVQGGRFNPVTKKVDIVRPPLGFSDRLFGKIRGVVLEWATGANAFVVLAMLEVD
ncbi:pumilio domain member 6, partial [Agyrium rufum]|nr:pumilio domain member 6 [Agyrium rufum]